eukprot:CAMPEP_0114342558 /NCGR_PEP_ID=MMETSP0101-20121206/9894_1 /TAXON_ID=38822 ORGANISM="Pteridomonas danica, Strain PT" /NCGR_SAMPLE_ID=MMETSP0101 /ASSEMBLY_ACC=CAM_ASM_000211 /LENGTH=595 /DNA_ID=CAMNT_0001476735 /DNA_START=305 /DNA_END=2089 /DNA_ORIENTATION=-
MAISSTSSFNTQTPPTTHVTSSSPASASSSASAYSLSASSLSSSVTLMASTIGPIVSVSRIEATPEQDSTCTTFANIDVSSSLTSMGETLNTLTDYERSTSMMMTRTSNRRYEMSQLVQVCAMSFSDNAKYLACGDLVGDVRIFEMNSVLSPPSSTTTKAKLLFYARTSPTIQKKHSLSSSRIVSLCWNGEDCKYLSISFQNGKHLLASKLKGYGGGFVLQDNWNENTLNRLQSQFTSHNFLFHPESVPPLSMTGSGRDDSNGSGGGSDGGGVNRTSKNNVVNGLSSEVDPRNDDATQGVHDDDDDDDDNRYEEDDDLKISTPQLSHSFFYESHSTSSQNGINTTKLHSSPILYVFVSSISCKNDQIYSYIAKHNISKTSSTPTSTWRSGITCENSSSSLPPLLQNDRTERIKMIQNKLSLAKKSRWMSLSSQASMFFKLDSPCIALSKHMNPSSSSSQTASPFFIALTLKGTLVIYHMDTGELRGVISTIPSPSPCRDPNTTAVTTDDKQANQSSSPSSSSSSPSILPINQCLSIDPSGIYLVIVSTFEVIEKETIFSSSPRFVSILEIYQILTGKKEMKIKLDYSLKVYDINW